jgi:hypothetical protein
MRAAGLALVSALSVSLPASATDLVNKDGATYAVVVKWGETETAFSLMGKAVKLAVCPATAAMCIVAVEDVGEIEVTGADDVLIVNGRLSKK